MSKHANRPMLAGGMEFLVGDTKPERGVELSGGLPNMNTAIDWTTFMEPEDATRIGMALIEGAGEVLKAREKARRDLTRWEAEA